MNTKKMITKQDVVKVIDSKNDELNKRKTPFPEPNSRLWIV